MDVVSLTPIKECCENKPVNLAVLLTAVMAFKSIVLFHKDPLSVGTKEWSLRTRKSREFLRAGLCLSSALCFFWEDVSSLCFSSNMRSISNKCKDITLYFHGFISLCLHFIFFFLIFSIYSFLHLLLYGWSVMLWSIWNRTTWSASRFFNDSPFVKPEALRQSYSVPAQNPHNSWFMLLFQSSWITSLTSPTSLFVLPFQKIIQVRNENCNFPFHFPRG